MDESPRSIRIRVLRDPPALTDANGAEFDVRGKGGQVLVTLAASPGNVPVGTLMEIWGVSTRPRMGTPALHTAVSGVRKIFRRAGLDPDRIVEESGRYRLVRLKGAADVDADLMAELLERARRLADGDPEGSVQTCRQALRLWRDPADPGPADLGRGRRESANADTWRFRLHAQACGVAAAVGLAAGDQSLVDVAYREARARFRKAYWYELLVALRDREIVKTCGSACHATC
jgi:hypothetical protein